MPYKMNSHEGYGSKIGNFKIYRGIKIKQEIHQVHSPYQNKSLVMRQKQCYVGRSNEFVSSRE